MMVKFMCDAGRTRIEEDGFTLLIHPDGVMYATHRCPDAQGLEGFDPDNAALLFYEVLDEHCMDCGDISLPDELKGIWYLYNFDKIQRGGVQ